MTYPMTERTTATRMRDRMSYDRDLAHAILDEAWHCTLSFTVDGEPRALPTLIVRIGETVYVHGSTGSRPLLAASSGDLRVCLSVTHLDGLVLARSQFHHSANYRSLVEHGIATAVTDESTKREVLTALVEKIGAGRSVHSRPPNAKELAQTTILALPLTEVSVRSRVGGVNDDEEDLGLPHWAGVLPLSVQAGRPQPATGVTAAMPGYLGRSPWLEPVVMRGKHVVLEPLEMSHARELFKALDDEEVWRYIPYARPHTPQEMAAFLSGLLSNDGRVAWVQRCAQTDSLLGTTSIFPEEGFKILEIGGTMLARHAWRTGANTEAKLMLMERAFDVLGAQRVSWQTDERNVRSRRAIERLGAVHEGTLRANRFRNDGTPRDSAIYSMVAQEWPLAQSTLRSRLED
jgi:RimJ/RimL family protein N-acetyltransferase/nitroimidazol reductase NimA-like FMN-containing flavoprotein (pyridoxamine 5'-phosphate oxidase superfamily)